MDADGGKRYIDSVMMRADSTLAWTDSAEDGGDVDRRVYYCQNWRADVSAIVNYNGTRVLEWVKYSAYGTPWCIAGSDVNADGVLDSNDDNEFLNLYNGSDAFADFDLSGTLAGADYTAFVADLNTGDSGGRGVQSRTGGTGALRNRIGYAGYHWDQAVSLNHVRYRAYVPELGRWTTRDPAGYVDGVGLYLYVGAKPINSLDSFGLMISDPPVRGVHPPPSPQPIPPDGNTNPWVWCIDITGYYNCRRNCDDVDAEQRSQAIAVRAACYTAAHGTYVLCMGDCLFNGTPRPSFSCAARHIACQTVRGIQESMCDAVYLGMLAGADLLSRTCAQTCRNNNVRVFPGQNCPPGWIPFNRDWGPIDAGRPWVPVPPPPPPPMPIPIPIAPPPNINPPNPGIPGGPGIR